MRGYLRSRYSDGGRTIQSAIAKNPMLHANCTSMKILSLWTVKEVTFYDCG